MIISAAIEFSFQVTVGQAADMINKRLHASLHALSNIPSDGIKSSAELTPAVSLAD